jgi:hypothetical protein
VYLGGRDEEAKVSGVNGATYGLALERRRHGLQRNGARLLALLLPPVVLLIAHDVTLVVIVVALIVGAAAGLLTVPFWPEDHLGLWLWSMTQRRWQAVGAIAPPRSKEAADQWLTDHPERRDEWAVSALLASGQFAAARALLSELSAPATAWQTFFRVNTTALLDLYAGTPVDIDALWSRASSIEEPAPRLVAQAQVANLGLSLAARGDITWHDAVRRIRRLTPALRLSPSQRFRLLSLQFPGFAAGLLFLVGWAVAFAAGYAHTGLP